MKYPKRVTVIELENAPFKCAKDAVCVHCDSDANLGEKRLWRSPRNKRVENVLSHVSQWRGRRSHSAFRQTLRIAQAICVQKCNIEVLKGNAGVEPLPSNKTSMDVGILLNGVCDVNGEPLLRSKEFRVKIEGQFPTKQKTVTNK